MATTRCYPKINIAESVYDLALQRIKLCYERYDTVVVSFSGGKDSTALLNLCVQAASELGRLPVRAVFYDEECIPEGTISYVSRTAARPEIALDWFCVPVKHRNACSTRSPWWYPWSAEDRHLWVRDLPAQAITEFPGKGFNRHPIPEVAGYAYPAREFGRVCQLLGLRTQESMQRYRAIATNKVGREAFFSRDTLWGHVEKGYPIYDWKNEDVWLAPDIHGWDYSADYDLMQMCGIPLHWQRVAPPFGEQPMKRLWTFKVCWPDLWAKMCGRVPGAATAARYSATELYGAGERTELEDGNTWKMKAYEALKKMPPGDRARSANSVRLCVQDHCRYTSDVIPDAKPHPVSGYCWKEIATIPITGGLKSRRGETKVRMRAELVRRRNGITHAPSGR